MPGDTYRMTETTFLPKSSSAIASIDEARTFFAANPDVDAVDIIFTTMSGVSRGKRLRQHEALAVYETGRILPGSLMVVDITGADTEETGRVWEDRAEERRVGKEGVSKGRSRRTPES